MNLNPYLFILFIIFIWGIYFLNSFYLNYKMRRFWPQKKIEEIFFIPFYVFLSVLSLKIYSYLLLGAQVSPDFSGFVKIAGMLSCLAAIFLFAYVTYFETFPSCLYIQRGENLRGIYNYIRHPSYTIFFLLTFGTAFYLDDGFLFVLACINHISLYFYYMIEEKRFVKKFPHHQEYLKKTRRFLPTFSKKR